MKSKKGLELKKSGGTSTHMYVFRSAKLIRPNRLVKTTPHTVLHGRLFSRAGYPFEDAYIKLLPTNLRAVEAVCAWIGRELGVPLPEPIFVTVSAGAVNQGCVWPFKNGEEVCFATLEIKQAKPVRRMQSNAISQIFTSWSKLVNAAVFDHLIANDDRSEENILLDARGTPWLIDHSRALGGAGQSLYSDPFPPTKNVFLEILKEFASTHRLRIRQELLGSCSAATALVGRIPYSGLAVEGEMAQQMQRFLQKRAQVLAPMLLSELGMPDLFHSATDNAGNGTFSSEGQSLQ